MSNQERRLMRRMRGGTVGGGQYPPGYLWNPQDEQDAKRDRLAEQILLEMVEYVTWDGTEKSEDDVRAEAIEALRTAAYASLAAAEVIYPEIPSGEVEGGQSVMTTAFSGWRDKLPAAAQEGARTVGIDYSDDHPVEG